MIDCLVDGELNDQLSAADRGLHYGDGLFETIAVIDGQPVNDDETVDNLNSTLVAVEEGVDAIVDIATLTGACVVALGNDVAGLMTNNQPWCDLVADAARLCGEPAWQLPMFAEYAEDIKSEVADIKNIGDGRWGYVGDDLPVHNVDWYQAVQYCNLLSDMDGLAPAYAIDGYQVVVMEMDGNRIKRYLVQAPPSKTD